MGCGRARGMIKFKTKLSINWYTIIVIANPSHFFFFCCCCCCFSSYSCFKLLTLSHEHSTARSLESFDIPHTHTPQKCTFCCFYYALLFFVLLCCVSVCFIYPCFFVTFRFFLLIKDNSNNIFLNIFCLLPSYSFSLFAVCVFFFFSLSFLLYCVWYIIKSFSHRVFWTLSISPPRLCSLLLFYFLFIRNIPLDYFNFNSFPLSHSLPWFLIFLDSPLSLSRSFSLPKYIYNCCFIPPAFLPF